MKIKLQHIKVERYIYVGRVLQKQRTNISDLKFIQLKLNTL